MEFDKAISALDRDVAREKTYVIYAKSRIKKTDWGKVHGGLNSISSAVGCWWRLKLLTAYNPARLGKVETKRPRWKCNLVQLILAKTLGPKTWRKNYESARKSKQK